MTTTIRFSFPQVGSAAFNCPRTCRTCETVDVCRFNLLLAGFGVRRLVNSETVSVDVAFNDSAALTVACERLGATVLGNGSWKIYGNQKISGFAFKMKTASDPVVLSGGTLIFDNLFARFDVDSASQLKAEYSIAAANSAAGRLGWLTERLETATGATLRVFHPAGGYLDVSTGNVEAFSFMGNGCHNAAGELAAAMGTISAVVPKPEQYQQAITQSQSNG